jgi:hypothetical protein
LSFNALIKGNIVSVPSSWPVVEPFIIVVGVIGYISSPQLLDELPEGRVINIPQPNGQLFVMGLVEIIINLS